MATSSILNACYARKLFYQSQQEQQVLLVSFYPPSCFFEVVKEVLGVWVVLVAPHEMMWFADSHN